MGDHVDMWPTNLVAALIVGIALLYEYGVAG